MVEGKYTIYDLSISLQNVSKAGIFDTAFPSQKVGEVSPLSAHVLSTLRVEIPELGQKDFEYGIILSARNGVWEEFLHIRRTEKGPLQAFEVYAASGSGKLPPQPIMKREFPH